MSQTRIASPFNALAVGLYIGAAVQGLLHVLGVANADAMIELFGGDQPGQPGGPARAVWALAVMATAAASFYQAAIRSRHDDHRWAAVRVELYTALILGFLFGFYWWTLAATSTVVQFQTTKIFALTLTLPPVARSIQILVELTKAGRGAARQVAWFRATRIGQLAIRIRRLWGARRARNR